MTESTAFLYELTLEGSADSAAELEAWVSGFVNDARQTAGFAGADVWPLDTVADRVGQVVQVRYSGDAGWHEFLDDGRVKQELTELFGEDVHADSRRLSDATTFAAEALEVANCENCGAVLTGQYCGQCGQRASGRLIRFPDLIREAFGDLFELDSRLWRTLIPLAVRPGQLTRDYLMGRRVRYMPPFRMYLVLSLLFFIVAFFNPRERLPILFEAGPPATQDLSAELELALEGENVCDDIADFDPNTMPGWLSKRLTRERLVDACENTLAEGETGFRSLGNRMLENIPAGLFVLLPVMAFVLMAIHPLSGRYYVEHLLFVLHFHSFIFLLLTIDSALARAVNPDGWTDNVAELAVFATIIYVPVYLYKSLRRVYESGHLATALRLFVLTNSYIVGLALIVAISALLAAFSA